MDENQPNIPLLPPELVGQVIAQQAVHQARMDAGLDVPRMWASIVGLSDDKQNDMVAFIFRDGVRAEYQIAGADGTMLPQSQEVFRTVASIIVPRTTAREFFKGALAHLDAQDAGDAEAPQDTEHG